MDINILRSMVTLAAFVAFAGILVWAYLPGRKKDFDDAANVPFLSGSE
ncbi:MAG: Cbb3-type cytochrome oxidase component FixQ [Polaromonas sp.]|nr:Cbb3-type cytochrome oxidase component FixQ [Polaromonas sp.]